MILVLFVAVVFARWARDVPDVQLFLDRYPGVTPLSHNSPAGVPPWLAWQHGLNVFFLLLIVRTGWAVRTSRRPSAHWTRDNTGLIRTKNPPRTISLDLWLHLTLDVAWLLNGVLFVVLLFSTGQWLRIVPTSWDVFPNAISAALQYVSLAWPTEDGWTNYNSLQVLAYFFTVFIAAPLAAITGWRMSAAWPQGDSRLNRLFPVEVARAIHFPVMLYFVLFTIAHVTLVFATGALRNLNHMYAARDDYSWLGFWIFAASLVVMLAASAAARPIILRPIAALTGKISR